MGNADGLAGLDLADISLHMGNLFELCHKPRDGQMAGSARSAPRWIWKARADLI